MVNEQKLVHLDDTERISWGGEEYARFLLRGSETGGRYSFYEVNVPPHEGSVFHIHEDTDEAFFVVEGELEIKVGAQLYRVVPGTLVYGPRQLGHSFYNAKYTPCRMLCIVTPGGIENFYADLSRLMTADPPPDWSHIRDLAKQHRISAVKPQGGPHGGPPETIAAHHPATKGHG